MRKTPFKQISLVLLTAKTAEDCFGQISSGKKLFFYKTIREQDTEQEKEQQQQVATQAPKSPSYNDLTLFIDDAN